MTGRNSKSSQFLASTGWNRGLVLYLVSPSPRSRNHLSAYWNELTQPINPTDPVGCKKRHRSERSKQVEERERSNLTAYLQIHLLALFVHRFKTHWGLTMRRGTSRKKQFTFMHPSAVDRPSYYCWVERPLHLEDLVQITMISDKSSVRRSIHCRK